MCQENVKSWVCQPKTASDNWDYFTYLHKAIRDIVGLSPLQPDWTPAPLPRKHCATPPPPVSLSLSLCTDHGAPFYSSSSLHSVSGSQSLQCP